MDIRETMTSILETLKAQEKFEIEVRQTKLGIEEITKDLKSNQKMFRLLQGDVGSGKTLVALLG